MYQGFDSRKRRFTPYLGRFGGSQDQFREALVKFVNCRTVSVFFNIWSRSQLFFTWNTDKWKEDEVVPLMQLE